jgi:hypothetical protein
MYDRIDDLAMRVPVLPPSLTEGVRRQCLESAIALLQHSQASAKAMQLDAKDANGDDNSGSSLKTVLRRALLGASWVVCAAPPERRERLLSELRLNPRISGYSLSWHELVAGQALFLSFALVMFIAFGAHLGRMFSVDFPAFPQNLEDVVFAWIVPEVLPFLAAFMVLFAVFADRPKAGDGSRTDKGRTFLTRLVLALVFAYVCAFGVRLWLSLSAMEKSTWADVQAKAIILALASIGTACIVLVAQKLITRSWLAESKYHIIENWWSDFGGDRCADSLVFCDYVNGS